MLRGSDGFNQLEWLMPFVSLGGSLIESDRQLLWYEAWGFVQKTERLHFKHYKQKNIEYTMERVLHFYEYCGLHYHHPIKWICTSYMSNFAQLEAMLMLKRWGLGGLPIEDYGCWQVLTVVRYLTLIRRRQSYDQWYYGKFKKFPQQRTRVLWEWRSKWVENLINEFLVTQYKSDLYRAEKPDNLLQGYIDSLGDIGDE